MIKGIIFDFDGTLVDTTELYADAYYTTLKEHGIEIEKEKIKSLFGYNSRRIFQIILNDKNKDNLDIIYSNYLSRVHSDEFFKRAKLKRGVKETLKYLKSRGALLFIVSGSNKDVLHKIIDKEKIRGYFTEIISIPGDGFEDKPSPEAIHYILNKYSLSKEEVVYVGDGKLDIEMSKRAGIRFIGIKDVIDEKDALENEFPFIYSFKELRRIFTKKLICIVGMAGSGKTTVRDILTNEYGFPFIRFGEITMEILKERGMEITEENERTIRESLRKEYGMEAYALLSISKIKEMLSQNEAVIIDGLYSWEEYIFLKDNVESDVDIILLGVISNKNQRYYRMSSRSERALQSEDLYVRDMREIKELNKAPPIVMADFYVCNNSTYDDLRKNIRRLMRDILLR